MATIVSDTGCISDLNKLAVPCMSYIWAYEISKLSATVHL